ncbi:MAG: GNAT family N-acetyltransferase [Gammaproteobacteria bacterium]|nr:GNAT family N-acetyltransferase [Gammaproteobacteria bacterium]
MIRIRQADWALDHQALSSIRRDVFVEEQGVPEAEEWDGLDAAARHWLAETGSGRPVGAVRVLPSGQIGRMAVRKGYRGQGIGRGLLKQVLDSLAADGSQDPFLNAQTAVIGFYQRFGFEPVGPVFDDAGIPHRRMVRRVSKMVGQP